MSQVLASSEINDQNRSTSIESERLMLDLEAQRRRLFGPSDAEQLAIGQSGFLLRYAAESQKDLDPNLALAIANARTAWAGDIWSPDVSRDFWAAFNELCQLIKPVTVNSLIALHENIAVRGGFLWRKQRNTSISRLSSSRNTRGLLLLLAIIVPLQLLVWVYTNLSAEIKQGSASVANLSHALSTKCSALEVQGTPIRAQDWSKEQWAQLSEIRLGKLELRDQSSQVLDAAMFLNRLVPQATLGVISLAKRSENDWLEDCHAEISDASNRSVVASTVAVRVQLLGAILAQFFLPILLGALGALAYVLRSTSEQIRDSTFSTTTPTRNIVRIVLGALMGVVVGLFTTSLTKEITLPPLALAFIAGYGVEGFFSIFDGFISRLRTPPANATPQ